AHLRELHAGRRQHDAEVRRDRARAHHLAPADAADGRPARPPQPAGRGGRGLAGAAARGAGGAAPRPPPSPPPPARAPPVPPPPRGRPPAARATRGTPRRFRHGQLGAWGCRRVGVASGPEPLEALRRAPFALVLLDMQMPGMDGGEPARAIAAERDLTPLP